MISTSTIPTAPCPRGDRHLLALPLHAHDGRQPLAQAAGALAGGVVLAGAAPQAQAFEYDAQARIAGAAIPDQILWRGVLLEPVQVAHFNVAAGTAECADLLARWRTAGCTIPEGAVSDPSGFLVPLLSTLPGLGQSRTSPSSSSLSSSSSSSSSAGATISAMASNWS